MSIKTRVEITAVHLYKKSSKKKDKKQKKIKYKKKGGGGETSKGNDKGKKGIKKKDAA